MKTPILITPRLRLRPMGWAAEKDYSYWLNDPEVVRYSEQRHRQHDAASCAAYIASFDHKKDHIWAIHINGNDGKHIGNISAHRDIPNNIANLGILIGDKGEWRKGFGLEAWNAVIEWAGKIGVRRVEAGCMGHNAGMMTICLKSGMRSEALVPDHFLLEDGTTGYLYIWGKNLHD